MLGVVIWKNNYGTPLPNLVLIAFGISLNCLGFLPL